jgi:hypothetical protein
MKTLARQPQHRAIGRVDKQRASTERQGAFWRMRCAYPPYDLFGNIWLIVNPKPIIDN